MSNEIIILKAIPEDAYGITLVRRKSWFTTYPNEREGITREDIELKLNQRTIEEETLQRKERIQNDKNFKHG